MPLPPDALDCLARRLLDAPAEELAATLYGVGWRSNVVRNENGVWRTRRLPLPRPLLDFLRDVLPGAIGHDGRSTRESRTAGWWLRTGTGWRPIGVEALAAEVGRAIRDPHDATLARRAAARLAAREVPSFDREDLANPLIRAVDDAAIRAAVVEALAVALDSFGRSFREALAALRDDERFRLPADAVDGIACNWLDAALADGRLSTPGGRLPVEDVRKALEADPVLPLQALFGALDRVLGPRARSSVSRFWRVPVESARAAA